MLDFFVNLLTFVGPFVIGVVTVPLFDLVMKYAPWLKARSPTVKQLLVVGVAAVLTLAGQFLNVVLPTDLSLFVESDVSALLSAAIAFAVKAGQKAKKAAAAAAEEK